MADESANGNGYVAALTDPDIRRLSPDFGPRVVNRGKAATPQRRNEIALSGDIGAEFGRTGLRHWGGFVFEEWLNQLQQGQLAAQVYREMQDSDPIVGSIMYAIQSLIRRVSWWVEPKGSKEAEWFERRLEQIIERYDQEIW